MAVVVSSTEPIKIKKKVTEIKRSHMGDWTGHQTANGNMGNLKWVKKGIRQEAKRKTGDNHLCQGPSVVRIQQTTPVVKLRMCKVRCLAATEAFHR